MRKEMRKEIELKEGIKLVSFYSKNGIYVYQDDKLVGAIANTQLLQTCRR